MGDVTPLRPANVDWNKPDPTYSPRFPWKAVLIGTLLVVAIGGAVYAAKQQNATEKRNVLSARYKKHVSPVADSVRSLRQSAFTLAEKAATQTPEGFVADGASIDALRKQRGLYLRVYAEQPFKDQAAFLSAAATEDNDIDAIPKCMGLKPRAMSTIVDGADFLLPRWLEKLRETDDLMRLRVLEEQLDTHIARDVPVFDELARHSDYLMLALQRGNSRQSAPVDLWLWSLPGKKLLASVRTKAKVRIVHAQVATGPATGTGDAPKVASSAVDCALAQQFKDALAGAPRDP